MFLKKVKKNIYSPKRQNKGVRFIFLIVKISFLLFLFLLTLLLIIFIYYAHDLPRPEKFTEKPFFQSTKIYDRTGKVLLYSIYGEEKRELIPLDRVSPYLKKAILASEDTRFYQHRGIDFKGIIRAILVDLKLKKPTQGGSTISQQLIRSSFLTRTKTLERKIKEIVLTVELERRYSKDQILEWYLNQIPFGENAYGVEAASQTYFKKSASDISIAEAAALAAMVPAPTYYSPYGPNKDQLLKRKDLILKRMSELGFIAQEELKNAKNEEVNFSPITESINAPHFVFYIRNYLIKEYGEEYLKEKGLRVYTTLDWELQKHVEEVVRKEIEKNLGYNANNAAAVVLNPKNGEILALVGSRDFFGKSYPEGCNSRQGECLFDPYFDVATLGKRQPGSAFKPFVYATAFQKGYTPSTILWDVKTEFNPNCSPDANQEKDQYGLDCYHPRNYDGTYRGTVSLRQSLAQSLNLPSVKLLYLAGLEESIKTAENMGITTLTDHNRYGLSLVLGGGEVNLLEMVSAYGVFANEGLRLPPVSILKIEDGEGNIIEENKKTPKRVLNAQIARTINDVLSDNEARVPVFARNNPLYFPEYQVAAKTGTTSNYVDVWTIGYTPFVVVGVWAGNNDNSPINKKSGIGLAAPIWRKIIEKVLKTTPKEDFIKPSIPPVTNPILNGEIPSGEKHSILHYINKDNPSGDPPQDPTSDPQYLMWEKGVQLWLSSNSINE